MTTERKQVLVVDDDRGVTRTIADLLNYEGYDTTTASTAEEALRYIRVQGLRPDVIVLDIGLPGLGGMGFLKEITTPSGLLFPVLVLTARAGIQSFLADSGVPVSGFLQKPCTETDLLDEIRHIISTDPALATTGRASGVRVLLGEGDRAICRALEMVLRDKGFHVLHARSGPDVVEMAASSTPALIVMNQILPRLNGGEAAHVIATMPDTKSIPVVLYGDEMFTSAHRSRPANVKRCLTSSSPDLIASTIAQLAGE